MTETSGFDGESKAAFVIGISYDGYANTPVFSVNKTEGEEVAVYLAYFPAGICGDNTVYLRIDQGKVYKVSGIYNIGLKRYSLKFNPDSGVTKQEFIARLKSGTRLYLRLKNECIQMDVDFSLNGSAAAIDFIEK